MSQLYGVGLEISLGKIQNDLKVLIMKKGGPVLGHLLRVFEEMDLNKNGKLDLNEFEKGLNRFGFFPKRVEVQALLKYYDKNNDNMMDFKEFCQALREPLNQPRFKIVSKAFENVSQDTVSVEELARKADFRVYEPLFPNKKTKEQSIQEFESHFYALGLKTIGKKEFCDYYEEISPIFPSDAAFISFVERTWGVSASDANTKEKEVIEEKLAVIRKTLIEKMAGKKINFENIRKLFLNFDTTPSFSLTYDEFANAIKKIRAPVEEKLLGVIFKRLDGNNSGFIEFQEFYEFLVQ